MQIILKKVSKILFSDFFTLFSNQLLFSLQKKMFLSLFVPFKADIQRRFDLIFIYITFICFSSDGRFDTRSQLTRHMNMLQDSLYIFIWSKKKKKKHDNFCKQHPAFPNDRMEVRKVLLPPWNQQLNYFLSKAVIMAENKNLFVKIAITSPAKTKNTTHFFLSAIILSLQRQGELKVVKKNIYGRYEALIKFSTSSEKKNPLKNDFPFNNHIFPFKNW